ncbi:hypothetical protein G4X40_03675 [Rhodococcus sp. D2-41]|uniref:Uncharacterized protein n=1 Tax=Speluncibacter jeojiensis TaxID=2710754 RepID=A0A9X4RER9_9ACTN|nr:hypothetical protein [Rhodococcus sp. D2-41]MDG3009242.1 hypothetical protein [Rhodococcus sp. D2-41]MDG3016084.1 hypothetical protein [Corynebacteriales bacterium D3-21]
MDDHDSDASLWEMLQISREDALPPLDDDVWEAVLGAALDPEAPEADDTLVPLHDDEHGIVDPGWGGDHDAAAAGADDAHHDLGGLLHDPGADPHDLGSLDHHHHDLVGHDPGHQDFGHPDPGGHDGGSAHDGFGGDGFGGDHPDLGGFDHLA